MNFQQEATKIYTVRVKSTGQEITFGVSTGEDPPPKIRLYHENKSIAVFIYSKQEDSYSELPAEKLDKFDLELMSKECSANRIRGDERSERQLAKLQKKLKERNNKDDDEYCFAGMVQVKVDPSFPLPTGNNVKIEVDNLKILKAPQATSSSPTSVHICWKDIVLSNEHLVNSMFDLEMSKSKNLTFQNVYSGFEKSYLKTGLLPGTKYYFRLRASKDSVKGPYSPEVFVVTKADVPTTPDIPYVSNKTKNHFVLKWTIKSDNGSPITSYILQWDKGHVDGQFETLYSGVKKQYKCNHKFPPKTTCRFRVKAINEIGESEFSPELFFVSSAGVPSSPDPPSLVKATASSLELSWKPPNDNGAEITSYTLQMDDELQGYGFLPVFLGSQETCIVHENLKRNTSYKFRLSATNLEGESKWSETVTIATKCESPNRMLPPVLEGQAHTKHFTVSWVGPSDNGGSEIVSYALELDDAKGGPFQNVYEGLGTYFKVQGLSPGHSYKVRVRCSSVEFKSEWSDVVIIKTMPVVPDPPSPPRQSKIQKEQSCNIYLEWDAPCYDGGSPVTNYNVQMQGPLDQDFRHVYFGDKTHCAVYEVKPNTEYLFRVRSQNVAGESKFSNVLRLCSGPGPPEIIEDIYAVSRSSSAIEISWKPPKTNGSPVTSYCLQYSTDPNGSFEKVFEGDSDYFQLKKNILPATVYYFRIKACSPVGNSQWSLITSCQTGAGPPAQVNHLKLINRNHSSMTIEWESPSDNGSKIISYNIDIDGKKLISYVVNNDDQSGNSNGVFRYTLSGLESNTQYRLRIQGVNKSGCGVLSSPLIGTTGKLPPEAPSLTLSTISYQSVKLRWTCVQVQGDSRDLKYDLQMATFGEAFESVLNTATSSHKLGKLQEQTHYSFRIRASNEAGFGPFSEIVNCVTSIQPPSTVKGFSYSSITKHAVTLVWKEVHRIKPSDIIQYILCVKVNKNNEWKQIYKGSETILKYGDVTPGATYNFQINALRIIGSVGAINKLTCEGPFSVLSLAIPCDEEKSAPDLKLNEVISEENEVSREISEKTLALIVFFVFAFLVLLISLFVSFFFT